MRSLCLLSLFFVTIVNAADAPALFQQHCAVCHGVERIGITGPALLPQSLERLRKPEALKVIRDGRAATQMLGFADRLNNDEITALGDYIYSAVLPAPTFAEADIRASRVVHARPGSLPAKPGAALQGRDLMNLFLVVETGDHHVSVLDGDKLDVVQRFPTRYALHGGPKFTADGRYVFFASRDGWVSKYDIWNLTMVAEIRVGLNTRNVAVSADGQHVIAANYLPGNLVLLDGELNLVKVIAAQSLDGKESSRVSAVYEAGVRQSFIAAMKDLPEIWEISFDPATKADFLNPRRTRLDDVLDDFYFDPTYAYVMGASRAGKAQVVNLDQRKRVADLDMSGMPHLGSGISFEWQGQRVMASPNLKEGSLSVIDMQNWQTVKRIETLGPGFFVRGHEKSPYFWADAMMSKEKHRLEIFDKRTLAKAGEVSVEPGKTLAHVEFDRYGKFVLASLWERQSNGGALIVYDAASFKEIKRLPMDKPVGKYNLYNKINRSEGTSH
jgi:cytochrome c553